MVSNFVLELGVREEFVKAFTNSCGLKANGSSNKTSSFKAIQNRKDPSSPSDPFLNG